MDIYEQKKHFFNDLPAPLSFLSTQGFDNSIPNKVKSFGNSFYLYHDSDEWTVTTPPCVVLKASINSFNGDDHLLQLKCPKQWVDETIVLLKTAVQLAHSQLHYSNVEFDDLWKVVTLPNFDKLEIRARTMSRRGKIKQFINVYNDKNSKEITGLCEIKRGATICANVRFVLSETIHDEGGVDIGIKTVFGAGVRVLTMAGTATVIKRPWDWKDVDFETLSFPLYTSMSVKTPALLIKSVTYGKMVIDISKKPDFHTAINKFHRYAGVKMWDGIICYSGRNQPNVGAIVVADVVPTRNSNYITWSAKSLHLSRPIGVVNGAEEEVGEKVGEKVEEVGEEEVEVGEKEVGKRDVDSMGNFLVAQTKRQCI